MVAGNEHLADFQKVIKKQRTASVARVRLRAMASCGPPGGSAEGITLPVEPWRPRPRRLAMG
jgi:hypothetical protein